MGKPADWLQRGCNTLALKNASPGHQPQEQFPDTNSRTGLVFHANRWPDRRKPIFQKPGLRNRSYEGVICTVNGESNLTEKE